MWFSNDMIREYLFSDKVIGSSPHNALPVYLEEELRFLMWFPSWCAVDYVLKYRSTGVELLSGSWRCDYKAADDLMQLSLSEYGYFTEPIKVEELEVSMVLCPLKPGLEEKVTIHPYICYQEKDDEDTFYVFPMEPNVEIKVSPVRITPLCRLVMH
nr:disease resistance protein TAO1-like [Ipomoea batatas]